VGSPYPIFDSLKIDSLVYQPLTPIEQCRGTTPATFVLLQTRTGAPYSGGASVTSRSVGGIATPAAW